MDKLKMEARPMDSILEKVAQICPAAVQDNKIDFERLKLELAPELNEDAESYNFTWVGKKDAIMGASTPIRKTLRPCKEESKNWDTTKNLYIEGDNLDVLKLLQESYLGKVKMIYIDPPYNTGNDFVYCDDFADSCEEYMEKKGQCDVETNERLFKNDETNGRFHSNWCSMIYPRLKVARDLLADDGVIFISIDDHEVANLRKICDEIFGEDNFIAQFVWKKNGRAGLTEKYIGVLTEYILLYAKNKPHCKLNYRTIEREYKYKDDVGVYNLENLERSANNSGYKTAVFPIQDPETGVDFYPQEGNGWMFGKDRALYFVKSNKAVFNYDNKRVLFKIYDFDYKSNENPYLNLLLDNGSSKTGGNEIMDLFGERSVFSYPKPSSLLNLLLHIGMNSNGIALDFFSGSATTAHAVMQLNAEDGGSRKFIMVQLPELTDEKSEAFKAGYKNICEIGKERIRRAGDKIVAETGKSDLDIGFKVLKLDETNMKDVYYNPAETSQSGLLDSVDNIKSDRSDLDLLYGVMIDLGLQLDLDISEIKSGNTTYYNVDDGSLVACFAQNIPDSIIKEIAELKPLKVVFRDSSFADAPAKINVTEIFKTISPNTKITVL